MKTIQDKSCSQHVLGITIGAIIGDMVGSVYEFYGTKTTKKALLLNIVRKAKNTRQVIMWNGGNL